MKKLPKNKRSTIYKNFNIINYFMFRHAVGRAEVADSLKSDWGRNLYTISELVKNNENLEKKFMGLYSDYQHDMKQSKIEGRIEGEILGINNTLKVIELYRVNTTVDRISKITGLSSKYNQNYSVN